VRRCVLALLLIAACGDRVGVKARGSSTEKPQWGLRLKLPPPE